MWSLFLAFLPVFGCIQNLYRKACHFYCTQCNYLAMFYHDSWITKLHYSSWHSKQTIFFWGVLPVLFWFWTSEASEPLSCSYKTGLWSSRFLVVRALQDLWPLSLGCRWARAATLPFRVAISSCQVYRSISFLCPSALGAWSLRNWKS